MRRSGSRWDPRFSHFRRIENALDHHYVRRVFPVLTTRSLSDRFRNIEASRTHFSLGYVSWLTFGVFWYVATYLFIFYSTTASFGPRAGMPFHQQPHAYTSDLVDSYRQGYQLVDDQGNILLDPDFDEMLLIPIGVQDSTLQSRLDEIENDVPGLCARLETHGVPERIRIMIHPSPDAPYRSVVAAIDAASQVVEGNPDCDVDFRLVTNQP